MSAAKKIAAPKGVGRPLQNGAKMLSCTMRLTPAQRDKVDRNGGAVWLRKLIDAAKG